jgi:hypothetical protein
VSQEEPKPPRAHPKTLLPADPLASRHHLSHRYGEPGTMPSVL